MPVRIQRYIVLVSVVLFLAKFYAWYETRSVAILTDTLESVINIITAIIGLYSVYLAAKPRDLNHPYGHSKIEFVSAAVEGIFILLAGIFILYEALEQLVTHQSVQKLDFGMLVMTATGLINFGIGEYALRQGKKHFSPTLQAAGQHLRTDAWTTGAIILGLGLLYITGWHWLDSAIAIILSGLIVFTGYKVARKSLAGIMDEADEQLLADVIGFLENNRRPQWIDMHNMRVIHYGKIMHIDAHVTLPWYYSVSEAEKEIHAIQDMIGQHFNHQVELFVHVDACASFSCKLCTLKNCPVRCHPFEQEIVWTTDNVWLNSKHGKQSKRLPE